MSPAQVILRYAVAALVGYVLGSIPSSVLISRLFGKPDPRTQGSGKTGATNAMRAMGKGPALRVVLLDVGKGVAAVLLARFVIFPLPSGHVTLTDHNLQAGCEAVAAFAALLGHNFSMFIGFKGGRGVATGGGGILAMAPLAIVTGLVALIIPIYLTRYVSLGSIISAAVAGLTVTILAITGQFGVYGPHAIFAVFGALFVIFSHRDNIERLLNGTERKLGKPSAAQE
ncbi:MAG: glycerol-3-phosphate 1-O-acyltransferase PlsY [Ktedonobacterales bacterium]